MRPHQHTRRGIALIWLAVFLTVLIGLIGLAIDTAWLGLVHHQLQNAADSSALAGARLVRVWNDGQVQARAAAQNYANLNFAGTDGDGTAATVQLNTNSGNDANGDIVVGIFNRNTGLFSALAPNSSSLPNALKVNARRTSSSLNGTQPLIFGSIFDQDSAGAARSATAIIAGGLGAGLLVLDPVGSEALQIGGGPELVVIDGTIQVNSSSNTAVGVNGNYSITGEELNIVGRMANPPTTIPVNMNMPVLPDPLSWLQAPDLGSLVNRGTVDNPNATIELQPGYYPGGIRATANGNNITCRPGIYYIGNPSAPANQNLGLDITGGTFTANQCTFYIAAGGVKLRSATITITPPPLDQGWYYEHISIFQSRTNYTEADIRGDNASLLEGTLYFPGQPDATPPGGPRLDLGGTFGGEGVQIITYRLRLTGGGQLKLLFDGWWPGPLTSRVYLVQ